MPAEINVSVTAISDASMTRSYKQSGAPLRRRQSRQRCGDFAIALVPLISFVGGAIDYSRVNKARSSMQAALDSTALMLSRDLSEGLITSSQVNATAQTYSAALYTDKDAQSVSVSAAYTASTAMGSTIELQGSGSVVTDFMKVAGYPNLN